MATAIKISLDTSDFYSKVNASVEQLNNMRKEWQIAAGLMYDEEKRLINQNGQYVESLSKAEIAEGKWIDSHGRLRNSLGQIIEGLNKAQIAVGMYKDDIGNLFDGSNNMVSPASMGGGDNFREVGQSLQSLCNTLLLYTKLCEKGGDKANYLSATLQSVSGGISAGISAFNSTTTAIKTFRKMMMLATASSKTLGATLKGLFLSNPFGIILGALAGVISAITIFNSVLGDTKEETEELKEPLSDIDKLWLKIGDSALQAGRKYALAGDMIMGIISGCVSKMEVLNKAMDRMRSLEGLSNNMKSWETEFKEFKQKIEDAYKIPDSDGTGYGTRAAIAMATSEYKAKGYDTKAYWAEGTLESFLGKDRMDEYNKQIEEQKENAKLLGDWLNQFVENGKTYAGKNTETDKLNAEIELAKRMLSEAKSKSDTDDDKIKDIQEAILGYEKKKKDIAEKEAADASERYLKSQGLGELIKYGKEKEEKANYLDPAWVAEKANQIKKLIDENDSNKELKSQYEAAQRGLILKTEEAKKIQEKENADKRNKARSELGIDKYLKTDDDLTKASGVADMIKKYRDALAQGTITKTELEKAEKGILAESNKSWLASMGIKDDESAIDKIKRGYIELEERLKLKLETESSYQTTLDKLNKQMEKEVRNKEKELENNKTSIDSVLGIPNLANELNSILNKAKTPVEKMIERNIEIEKNAEKELKEHSESAELTAHINNQKQKALNLSRKLYELQEKELKAEKEKKQQEETKRNLDSLYSGLGIEKILEDAKSPMQRFFERVAKLDQLVAAGRVTRGQRAIVMNDLYRQRNDEEKKLADEKKKGIDSVSKSMGLEKYKAPESMMSGSANVYKAWSQNQSTWQNRIVDNTVRINQNTLDCKKLLETLVDKMEDFGSANVWR